MPPEVVNRLHCPSCIREGELDPGSSIEDNGWAVEYDMEVAGFSAANLPGHLKDKVSPSMLFDEGYATWRGIYPGDHVDSAAEREEIVKLAKVDPKEYMVRIREWANSRMQRLAREGWRKANAS
jgi:hypothetical protein